MDQTDCGSVDMRDIAPGLKHPMAFVIFIIMLGILVYVLSLPGNLLNPLGSNSTVTGWFARGSNVLVFNPSTSTIGLLAIVVPLCMFWILRSWAGDESEPTL